MSADANEAERSVISVALAYPLACEKLSLLRPEHFGNSASAAMWRAIRELVTAGVSVDRITVERRLAANGDLERVGGSRNLVIFTTAADTMALAAVEDHARIIIEAASRRYLATVASQLVASANDDALLPSEAVKSAIAKLEGLDTGGLKVVPIGDVINEIDRDIARRRNGEEIQTGIPTGIASVDEMLTFGGLPRGQVTIFAGATSSGKSALGNTCLLSAASRGKRVLCCAFEDSAKCVVNRLLSQVSRIPNKQLQRAVVGFGEMESYEAARNDLREAPVDFTELVPPDISELTATIRQQVYEKDVGLVIIDFLQLLRTTTRHHNRQGSIDEIFSEIVSTARKLPCATLVISQLRRTDDRPPTKQDLYHSGSLEQWSHTIGLLWRPLPDRFPDMVSFILDKQKNGPIGQRVLGWNGDLVMYRDADLSRLDDYNDAIRKFRQ